MILPITVFDCAADATPKPFDVEWPEAFNQFRPAGAGAGEKDGVLWSPAAFEGGRKAEHVRHLVAFALDFDAKTGSHDPKDISATWRGVEHVVHSTYSPGSYRLIVPYTRPVTPDEHREIYAWALSRSPAADPSCKNASRMFYWPTARTDLDTPPLFLYNAGAVLDPGAVTGSRPDLLLPRPPARTAPSSKPPPTTSPVGGTGGGAEAYAGIDRVEQREDIDLIESRCAFMRHARADAATLHEPEWYAWLSIVARCKGGDELAHTIGSAHPSYSRDDTDAKYQRAKGVGPRTCADIRVLSPACKGCPLAVTSPVLLGRPDPVAEAEEEDPLEVLKRLDERAQAARVDEDKAVVELIRAKDRVKLARREGSPEDIEREVLAVSAASAEVRRAASIRKAAEREYMQARARLGVDGLPAGADAAVWPRLSTYLDASGVHPKDTLGNVLYILEHDPKWSSRFSRNDFANDVCIDGVVAPEEQATELAAKLAYDYGLDTSSKRVIECVRVVAARRRFHPVRDWLATLRWDGTPRVDDLLFRGFSAVAGEDPGIIRRISRKFMLSLLARVYQPGCQVDTMLVLVGAQGEGKSHGIEDLIPNPSWFGRTKITIGDKDGYLQMRGKWLYELGEMEGVRKAEANAVKSWMSSATDNYRVPYGMRSEDHPRQTVVVGTTNQETFIDDPTGRRRYWTVRVGNLVDRAWIQANRDQLFAEACAIRASGNDATWWFDSRGDEAARVEALSSEYTVQHPWLDAMADWLRTWGKNGHSTVTPTQVLSLCFGRLTGDLDAREAITVGTLLKQLHCTKGGRTLVDGVKTTVWTLPAGLVVAKGGNVVPMTSAAK